MGKYIFKPYSERLPFLFTKEKERIASYLPKNSSIEHVGSTSVPGLGGKGIIDIAISVDKAVIEEMKSKLQAINYEFRPQYSTVERLYFVTFLPDFQEGAQRYHVHLTYNGSKEWKDLIDFRYYLRSHPQAAQEYCEVKMKAVLEAQDDGKKYRALKEPIFEKFRKFHLREDLR